MKISFTLVKDETKLLVENDMKLMQKETAIKIVVGEGRCDDESARCSDLYFSNVEEDKHFYTWMISMR